jgi:hypothetical protein
MDVGCIFEYQYKLQFDIGSLVSTYIYVNEYHCILMGSIAIKTTSLLF